MCFPIDIWCCFGAVRCRDDDYGGGSTARPLHGHAGAPVKTPHYAPAPAAERGFGYHHHGNGHPHHNQLPVAHDEEDRKASNDARRGGYAPAPGAAATKGAHEKAYGALRHPAANATIAADGGAHYY